MANNRDNEELHLALRKQQDGSRVLEIRDAEGNSISPTRLGAQSNSPSFTGDPNAPTATQGDDDLSVATTHFVKRAIDAQHVVDNGTYAQKNANTVALLGDSITDNNSGPGSGVTGDPTDQTQARGYFTWANMLLGQRCDWVKYSSIRWEFGAVNLTAVDLITLGHVANVIAAKPAWCIVEVGTNDIATGADGDTTAATVISIWDSLLAAGIRVIATTIIDKSTETAPKNQYRRRANYLLRSAAAARRGVVLCDWDEIMRDSATGLLRTGYTLDGTHPNSIGAALMGRVLADTLAPLIPPLERFPSTGDGAVNALDQTTNGSRFVGGTGLSPAWTTTGVGSGASAVATKVARTDYSGEIQKLVTTDASYNGYGIQCNTGGSGIANGYFAIGEYLRGMIEFTTAAADTWDVKNFQLSVLFTGASGSVSSNFASSTDRTALTAPTRKPETVTMLTPAILVPTGATQAKLNFNIYGGGTFYLTRAAILRSTSGNVFQV